MVSANMNIAVRVDASNEIGTGHFMRCLALAAGLKRRGAHVRFISRHSTEHLRSLVVAGGHEVVQITSPIEFDPADTLAHAAWLGTSQPADARDSMHALSDRKWDWLIVDHYALDARWESALRKTVARILAVDDIADRAHDCDILVDQNLHLDAESRYAGRVPERCRTLLGPRYALLREAFAQLRSGVEARTGRVRRVLVFFGGIDAGAHTGTAVEALATLRDFDVDVVIGAQHGQRHSIEDRCKELGFICHVQTDRMPELIASADLAIGAAGSSSWERCCLGVPTLAMCVADNQRQLIEGAALAGLIYAPAMRSARSVSMAEHLRVLLDNPLLLRGMSLNGMRAVDGRGTERVLRAMGFCAVTMREATGRDSSRVFEWRNHPSVRATSRNPDAIERSAHEAWFSATLASPDRLLLIGERDGNDVGVVRFDVRDRAAEISIYLAPDTGGRGNGAEMLRAAESWLASNRPEVSAIEAAVLHENRRSHCLFRAGGYRLESSRYVKRLA